MKRLSNDLLITVLSLVCAGCGGPASEGETGSDGRSSEPSPAGSEVGDSRTDRGEDTGVITEELAAAATPWLPFDLPSRKKLADARTDTAKGVFIHSFSPLMPNFNKATMAEEGGDKAYLPPGRSADQSFGGAGRDWSPWRQPSTKTAAVKLMDGTSSIPQWQLDDYMSQVEAARDAGVDGFFISVQVVEKGHSEWERSAGMVEAINRVNAAHPNDPKFWAILRHDGIASATSTTTKLVDSLTWMWSQPSAYKTSDGSLLISPLNAEKAPDGAADGVNFYTSVKNKMAAAGKPIKIWPVYISSWTDHAPDFNGIAFGHSRWGDRSASSTAANTVNARGAAAHSHTELGKPWMAPVSAQDFRPRDRRFWEAWGFGNMVASWESALQSGNARANWVNIPTFNDFLESSHIGPSRKNGNDRSYSPWLDVISYYLTWFKLDSKPAIVRDGLYIAHRLQLSDGASATKPGGGTNITGPQTEFATIGSGMAVKNDVDVLVFAKSAGTVEITVGGVKTTKDVPAGVSQVKAPAHLGTVSATLKRSGATAASVTSPHKIVGSLISQDLTYYVTSSLR
ncbi:hypothetical protein LVJ94_03495 [Pendulispora rubella]|uniref:Uncharacterized protein n=1 Tax=Pendulispora rubella TaxID=2741070 RepID=A0ABZ2L5T7_9BACT